MTVQVDYTATGGSNVFPFPFAIETEADCQVLIDGVPQGGDYCVRGQGSIDGGAVVFDNPPVAGATITLRRRSDLRVDALDAEGGYLADKLLAGDNITLETVSQDGVQRLRVTATGQDVSVAELAAVLKAGTNVTLTPDGNGRLVVAAKTVDASDLAAVLKAGGNISLLQDANGRLEISAESVDAAELLAVLRAGANVTVSADGAGHVVVAADAVDASDLAAVLKVGANVTLTPDGNGRLVVAADAVDASDLAAVLKAGSNVTLSTDADGRLVVAADAVDASDLAAVLKAGSNVTLSTDADGRLVVAADAVDASDLAAVLKAGSNVTLSTDVDGRLVVAAQQPDMSKVLYRNVSAQLEKGFWTSPVALTAVNGVATPDPLAGNVFTITLTANLTLGFPAGLSGKAGMFLVVAKQDATGGRALTLASGYVLASGSFSTTANTVNLLWVTSDGSGNVLDVVVAQRGEV